MKTRKLFFLILSFFIFNQVAFAEESKDKKAVEAENKKEEPEEKVRTGVIASTGKTGKYGSIDVDTTGSSPGDEVNAISSSINRAKRGECIVTIKNNGKKTYSVSFSAEGMNQRGVKTLSRSFSATVSPMASVNRIVNNCSDDLNLLVNLKSAKVIGK